MEVGHLTFIDGLDRRGGACVHVIDRDRKYVATFYGHSLKDGDRLRNALVDYLAHAAVLEWVNKHGEEAGLGEVRGHNQQDRADDAGPNADRDRQT